MQNGGWQAERLGSSRKLVFSDVYYGSLRRPRFPTGSRPLESRELARRMRIFLVGPPIGMVDVANLSDFSPAGLAASKGLTSGTRLTCLVRIRLNTARVHPSFIVRTA